jgi:hypothetical protein
VRQRLRHPLALDNAPYAHAPEGHATRRATTLAAIDRPAEDEPQLNVIKQRLANYRREYWKRLGVTTTD